MQTLILASSSPSRKKLMQRLRLSFECVSPDVDETPLSNELPEAMVKRLAEDKAQKIALQYPEAIIIACDQTIVLGDQMMGKPLTHERATEQLKKVSGQVVNSLTGMVVLNARTQQMQYHLARYDVFFRELSDDMIENYLQLDQPYHCAGSIKAEELGVVLFEKMQGDDPTALIGLPLIALVQMLEREGLSALGVGSS